MGSIGTNGESLFAKPYIKQTWAKKIGKDRRPVELPDQRPTPKGTLTCPDLFGGTNFMSRSYDPARLFFVSARETRMVYVSQPSPSVYNAGDRTMGGSFRAGGERGDGALRAIGVATGDVK